MPWRPSGRMVAGARRSLVICARTGRQVRQDGGLAAQLGRSVLTIGRAARARPRSASNLPDACRRSSGAVGERLPLGARQKLREGATPERVGFFAGIGDQCGKGCTSAPPEGALSVLFLRHLSPVGKYLAPTRSVAQVGERRIPHLGETPRSHSYQRRDEAREEEGQLRLAMRSGLREHHLQARAGGLH